MGFFDLLWIFFMLSALQPVLQQRLLEMRRLRLLAQLRAPAGQSGHRPGTSSGDHELAGLSAHALHRHQ